MSTRTVFDPANPKHRAALRRRLILDGTVAATTTLRQLKMLDALDALLPPKGRRRKKGAA